MPLITDKIAMADSESLNEWSGTMAADGAREREHGRADVLADRAELPLNGADDAALCRRRLRRRGASRSAPCRRRAGPAAAPTAAPETSPLPEIGRVRSTAPACAALRDLIVPSFSAAQRADNRFVQTRLRLPQYAEIAADKEHHNDVFRTSALARLDADATALLTETQWLDKALRDPRLKDTTDPQVVAERTRPPGAVRRAEGAREPAARVRHARAQRDGAPRHGRQRRIRGQGSRRCR